MVWFIRAVVPREAVCGRSSWQRVCFRRHPPAAAAGAAAAALSLPDTELSTEQGPAAKRAHHNTPHALTVCTVYTKNTNVSVVNM